MSVLPFEYFCSEAQLVFCPLFFYFFLFFFIFFYFFLFFFIFFYFFYFFYFFFIFLNFYFFLFFRTVIKAAYRNSCSSSNLVRDSH